MGELREKVAQGVRWIGVRLSIARGFAAWCFYMVWPTWWGKWFKQVGFAALPYAGDYAFADDPYVKESRAHWIRTGRNLKSEADHGPF